MLSVPSPTPFFFSSRRRHTRSVSAFLLNRSSDLALSLSRNRRRLKANQTGKKFRVGIRSEERRVGKECRFRWVSYPLKKKVNLMVGIRGRALTLADLAAAGIRRVSV